MSARVTLSESYKILPLEPSCSLEQFPSDASDDGTVEMDGRPKARQEFHVSDTVRGNDYATTRVVRDTPYVITARRAL